MYDSLRGLVDGHDSDCSYRKRKPLQVQSLGLHYVFELGTCLDLRPVCVRHMRSTHVRLFLRTRWPVSEVREDQISHLSVTGLLVMPVSGSNGPKVTDLQSYSATVLLPPGFLLT